MCIRDRGGTVYRAVHNRRPAFGVAVAVAALLPYVIFSGHTSLRPNKSWPGSIRLYDPHDSKLCVTLAVYISRRRGDGPVAALHTYAPRCLADLERFFAKHAEHAGIFQHPPGEFHRNTPRF